MKGACAGAFCGLFFGGTVMLLSLGALESLHIKIIAGIGALLGIGCALLRPDLSSANREDPPELRTPRLDPPLPTDQVLETEKPSP